ncbi:hypothetical protein TWF569_001745 [Orbilia oligospora]|nr:hypothetical protein TWF569_001745 [Orbilia oligospora]
MFTNGGWLVGPLERSCTFSTNEEWYNDIANYRLLPDAERSTAGLYEWTMRQFPKARDVLGPFIPENQFSEKMEEILLPKALQSFEANLGFTSREYDYLLPVVRSATVKTLSIRRASYPFAWDFNFQNIKNLTLNFNSAEIDIYFDQMEDDWGAWEDLEQDEDLDSDYVASGDEEHGSSILLNDTEEESGSGDSEFSGDSEYPETGDELYPVDTDDELE